MFHLHFQSAKRRGRCYNTFFQQEGSRYSGACLHIYRFHSRDRLKESPELLTPSLLWYILRKHLYSLREESLQTNIILNDHTYPLEHLHHDGKIRSKMAMSSREPVLAQNLIKTLVVVLSA